MSFSSADTKNITCQHLPTKIEGNKIQKKNQDKFFSFPLVSAWQQK